MLNFFRGIFSSIGLVGTLDHGSESQAQTYLHKTSHIAWVHGYKILWYKKLYNVLPSAAENYIVNSINLIHIVRAKVLLFLT